MVVAGSDTALVSPKRDALRRWSKAVHERNQFSNSQKKLPSQTQIVLGAAHFTGADVDLEVSIAVASTALEERRRLRGDLTVRDRDRPWVRVPLNPPALPGRLDFLTPWHSRAPRNASWTDSPLRDRRSRRLWGNRKGRLAQRSRGRNPVRANRPDRNCVSLL